jgi:DNA-binding IclR family transcriptional regulator
LARTPNTIQSVERTVKILDALTRGGEPGLSLGEVSQAVEMQSSTVHHLLASLIQFQMVEQDPISKRYRLGLHLIELGSSAMSSTTLARVARRPVEQVANATRQSCSLLGFHGLVRTPILSTSSQEMLLAQPAPLNVDTLHATGSGKLLLAFLPDLELADYLDRARQGRLRLERFTAYTLTNPSQLIEELQEIRMQRYALDHQEYGLGVNCISAAVQDASQSVVGCLDMVFPIYNVSQEQIAEWTATMCQAATALSNQLRELGLKVR